MMTDSNDCISNNEVLHVIGKLGSGGIESFVMAVLEKIDKRFCYDFLVFFNEPNFYEEEIKRLGCNVITLLGRNHLKPIRVLLKSIEFWKLLRRHKEYKIVHIHVSRIVSAIVFVIVSRMNKRKVIVHGHCSAPRNYNGVKAFGDKIWQWIINRFEVQKVACSESAAEYIFGTKENVAVVYNGIDYDKFAFSDNERAGIRGKYHITENCCLLGNVARLSKEKNQAFLVEVLRRLGDGYKLMLVGTGPEKEALKKHANQLGLQDDVIFIGPTKAVNSYLSAMDVFLMASLQEGLCNSVIEAQANGMPCICSNGVPEIVKYSNNVKFLELDTGLWVNQIKTFKSNTRCAEEKNTGDLFDIKRNAKMIENIYSRLLGEEVLGECL